MPMKYRSKYPDNWNKLAREIKAANHWQCQACDRECQKPGEAYRGGRNVLTVAHADPHSYDAPEALLVAICTVCHLRMDSPHRGVLRQVNAVEREQAQARKRREAGQREFELQFPLWLGGAA